MNAEENARLTQTGPGTPCGEMMRRYWIPVRASETLGQLPLLVRILGEDLILFRDGRGRPGLLAKHCSHRGTSLEYAQIEEEGIRCCYHGWLYDVEGRVLDTPAEPPDSNFKLTVRHLAYPCRELGGWIFAYMGPTEKMPELPGYDFLVREDGTRDYWSIVHNYNWLQNLENMADPVHTAILHRIPGRWQFGEYQAEIPVVDYERTEDGLCTTQIRSSWSRRNRFILPVLAVLPGDTSSRDEQPGVPGQESRQLDVDIAMQIFWTMPIDDEHHMVHRMIFTPFGADGRPRAFRGTGGRAKPMTYEESQATPTDTEAQESQGLIGQRQNWRFASSDSGVVLFEKIVREAIDAVERGDDPPGVIRDTERARFLNTRDSIFIKLDPRPLEPWRWDVGKTLWSKRLLP